MNTAEAPDIPDTSKHAINFNPNHYFTWVYFDSTQNDDKKGKTKINIDLKKDGTIEKIEIKIEEVDYVEKDILRNFEAETNATLKGKSLNDIIANGLETIADNETATESVYLALKIIHKVAAQNPTAGYPDLPKPK